MNFLIIITLAVVIVLSVHADNTTFQHAVGVPSFNYTQPSISIKIVGGSPARNHQFPWQASITSCVGRSCSICGGSLISPRYVLTAAHCTEGVSTFTIGLGSNTRKRPAVSLTSRVKIEHPQYNSQTLSNDISIIRLPREVTLNSAVQTIALPSSSISSLVNQDAIVSGYGKTSCNYKLLIFCVFYLIIYAFKRISWWSVCHQ